MNEAKKRMHRACFTGHRPEKLLQSESIVKANLEYTVKQALVEGYNVFISGMARGVDIWAAEVVLSLRTSRPNIRLICALPHPDFEKSWSHSWQKRFHSVLCQADLIRTISPSFSMDSYQKRNEWMVDHSSLVIALYNGSAGGTKNTIEYAALRNIPVINILDSYSIPPSF